MKNDIDKGKDFGECVCVLSWLQERMRYRPASSPAVTILINDVTQNFVICVSSRGTF